MADALVGASDDIELRPSSTVDGEAELAVVIDKTARAADEQRTIDTQLHAAGEADKVWRRLWLEGRVVVLADGLDEVLADTAQPADRYRLLREAIRDGSPW